MSASTQFDALDGYIARNARWHRRDLNATCGFVRSYTDHRFAVILAGLAMTREVIGAPVATVTHLPSPPDVSRVVVVNGRPFAVYHRSDGSVYVEAITGGW